MRHVDYDDNVPRTQCTCTDCGKQFNKGDEGDEGDNETVCLRCEAEFINQVDNDSEENWGPNE